MRQAAPEINFDGSATHALVLVPLSPSSSTSHGWCAVAGVPERAQVLLAAAQSPLLADELLAPTLVPCLCTTMLSAPSSARQVAAASPCLPKMYLGVLVQFGVPLMCLVLLLRVYTSCECFADHSLPDFCQVPHLIPRSCDFCVEAACLPFCCIMNDNMRNACSIWWCGGRSTHPHCWRSGWCARCRPTSRQS